MKKTLVTLVVLLVLNNLAYSQIFEELVPSIIEYEEDDEKVNGLMLKNERSLSIRVLGSDDTLSLKNLSFSNMGFAEAYLSFQASVCGYPTDYQEEPGDFFITISFYDENKNCLVSESFISVNGCTLYEEPSNSKSNAPMTLSTTDYNCYDFTGSSEVPIHHAFLYEEDQGAGGIKPIRYFRISAFHLCAG